MLNESEGLAGYELNISCPNVKSGGLMYGSDPVATREVVEAVKLRARRPVLVKLSPNVTDIRELARAAEDGGADALSLVNTLTGMSVDVESFRPRLGNITGGLSGPAIKPVALRMVYEVVRTVGIPVVAIGGIRTAEDALEYLIVGARAVQVGTANFVDPQAPLKVIRGLGDYCRRKGFPSIRTVIGRLRAD